MANELQFYGLMAQSGLTVIAKIYNNAGIQVGSNISCPEVGTSAIYIGDMPAGTPADRYTVRFIADDEVIGAETLVWDGTTELDVAVADEHTVSKIDELHIMRGLDPAAPVTITPTEETAGPIEMDITGDGETTSTLTRR